jgi:hypothetical protein
MQNYEVHDHRLPPAVLYGEDDRPLLSWRVLLLPYVEQQELYNEFKLDEPWDSPHNIAMLPKMPYVYALPPRQAAKIKMPDHHTICHVFVGRRAAFEGKVGLRLRQDFPDGPSNTILIIEAGEPVPWTKPEELNYAPDEPLPNLLGPFWEGFRVGMADGSVRWVRKDISESTLGAAITRNGHDMLGPDW